MRYTLIAVALAVVLCAPGCGKKPTTVTEPPVVMTLPEKVEKARKAGELSAYAFIVAYKGEARVQTIAAVEGSIRRINDVLKDYPKKGFRSVLPELEKCIDVHFDPVTKKAENLLARKLAEVLLDELDVQFQKHPEWGDASESYIAVVQAFTQGATTGFKKYRIEKSIKETQDRRIPHK